MCSALAAVWRLLRRLRRGLFVAARSRTYDSLFVHSGGRHVLIILFVISIYESVLPWNTGYIDGYV